MTDTDPQAGPELDAQMAELMGWTKHEHQPLPLFGTGRHWKRPDGTRVERWHAQSAHGEDRCWPFSTDWSAAGEVVEHFRQHDCSPLIYWDSDQQRWLAGMGDRALGDLEQGETAPLAICRAARKAVEKTDGD